MESTALEFHQDDLENDRWGVGKEKRVMSVSKQRNFFGAIYLEEVLSSWLPSENGGLCLVLLLRFETIAMAPGFSRELRSKRVSLYLQNFAEKIPVQIPFNFTPMLPPLTLNFRIRRVLNPFENSVRIAPPL